MQFNMSFVSYCFLKNFLLQTEKKQMFLFLNLQLFWIKIKEKYFLFNWLYLNQSLTACQIRSKLRCQLKVDGQLSVGISALSEFEPERIFEHT